MKSGKSRGVRGRGRFPALKTNTSGAVGPLIFRALTPENGLTGRNVVEGIVRGRLSSSHDFYARKERSGGKVRPNEPTAL